MPDSLHHLYGPSSLSRRERCPGSARMEKDLPGFETEHAAEGTRLHAEIAGVITESITAFTMSKIDDDTVSKAFARFVNITLDNIQPSEDMWKRIRPGGDIEVKVEQRLVFSYCGIEQFSGTADVLIVMPDKVIVIDWKTGHREVEDASDNLQTAAYAVAAMQMYHRDKASVYIYNPVIGQDTHYDFDKNKRLFAVKLIAGIIAKCEAADAPLCPGDEQCRYCKAAYHGTCPALANTAELTAAKAEEIVPIPALSVIPEDALCELKAKCDLIAKLAERVDAEIRRRLEKGEAVGTWKIKEMSGGREIIDINRAFALAGLPDADFLSACTCSAAKLEKAYCVYRSADFPTQKAAKVNFSEKLADVLQDRPRKKMLVKG